eukprot:EC785659.1.p2 GENE.EC785659.1~~EC785659.1.p2  ORF type:complete len:75 (+),score=16.04 EC785659.1:173-397(+)
MCGQCGDDIEFHEGTAASAAAQLEPAATVPNYADDDDAPAEFSLDADHIYGHHMMALCDRSYCVRSLEQIGLMD